MNVLGSHSAVGKSLRPVVGCPLNLESAVVQAQTVANFYLAFEQNLAIVPVLNKCDMRTAEPDQVAEQMQQVWVLHNLQSRGTALPIVCSLLEGHCLRLHEDHRRTELQWADLLHAI